MEAITDLNILLFQTQDAFPALQSEHEELNEMSFKQRGTIKGLSARAIGRGGRRLVPILEPRSFNCTAEDLDTFLDRSENKLRGDAT